MRVSHMRIDLSGGNIAVAQQRLYAPEIRSVHEQISGERVSECMRRHMLGNAGHQGVPGYHSLDAAGSQAMKVAAHVNLLVAAIADKERTHRVSTLIQVLLNPTGRGRADEYRPVFLALTAYHELQPLQIDVILIQTYEFGNTQS